MPVQPSPEDIELARQMNARTQPVPMPNAAPQPADPLAGLMDVGLERKAEMDRARLEGLRVGVEKRKEDLSENIAQDLTRAPSEPGKAGILGGFKSDFAAKPLSEQEIRAKYGDEAQSIADEQRALEAAQTVTPQDYVEDPNVQLVSDEQGMQDLSYNPQTQAPSPVLAAYDDHIAALQNSARVGTAAATEEAAYLRKMNEEQTRMAAEQEAKFMAKLEKQEEALAKLQAEEESVNKMKADPGRYWANKSTGDKILAGIAMFLGASGGVVGRGNTAVRSIDAAIDKDIAEQNAQIAAARTGVDRKTSLVGKMMDVYGDQRLAMNAARAAAYQGVENDLNIMASKYKGQEIQARAQELIADVGLKKAAAVEELQNRYAMMASYQGGDVNPMMLDKDSRERYVKGYGLARNAKVAEDLDTAVVAMENANSGIAQLMALGNKPGRSLSLEDRAKASSIQSLLQGALRVEVLGPGTVQEAERELLRELIADPTRIFSLDSSTKVRLNTLRERITTSVKNKMAQMIQVPMGAEGKTKTIREIPASEHSPNMHKASAKR